MKFLRLLGHEYFLGSLIAILSVLTAMASFQGSMADSKQNEFEIKGMTSLNDGNAEYLSANQFIVYDYTLYDSWYTTEDETKAAYFEESYSDQLVASIAANPDDPFNEDYYSAMYASADELFTEADTSFETASQYDNRGDELQLVMLLMALGLAFAAWGSLLKEESNLRVLFAIASFLVLVLGVLSYLTVTVVG
jgi:hypothetical protein